MIQNFYTYEEFNKPGLKNFLSGKSINKTIPMSLF